jgi:HEAT repeat protein
MGRVDELIRQLRRGRLKERIRAAEALGQLGDPKAVPALIEGLEDADERVWYACIEAVRKIGDLKAIRKLIDKWRKARFYKDFPLGKQIIEAVSEILGRTSPDDDENREVFSNAVNWLIDVVRDTGPDVLISRGYGLNQREAFSQMRAAAVEALGKTRNPKAISVLANLFREEYAPAEVETAAVHALSNFNTPQVVRTLVKVAAGELASSKETRKVAIESLGALGDPKAVDTLTKILEKRSEDEGLRIHAALALGRIGDPKAIDTLTRTLENRTEYLGVRKFVADALGNFHDPRVTDALVKALSCDYYIARAAAESLKKLRDRRAVEPLIRILESDSGKYSNHPRELAADILGVLGDPRAVPALAKALRDNDRDVHTNAFNSLQRFILTHPDAVLRIDPDDRHLLGRRIQDAQRDELLREICK